MIVPVHAFTAEVTGPQDLTTLAVSGGVEIILSGQTDPTENGGYIGTETGVVRSEEQPPDLSLVLVDQAVTDWSDFVHPIPPYPTPILTVRQTTGNINIRVNQ